MLEILARLIAFDTVSAKPNMALMHYVRDVLDPEQSFNPESALSIAKAVKRYLAQDEQALTLLDAADFIKCVLQG